MKTNPEQLDFDLPAEVHPGVVQRRELRERVKAQGEDAERAALLARHRQEWDDHLDLWWDAHYRRNLNLARLAKTQAETLKLRQADERKAWGLDDAAAGVGQLSPEENLARIRELLKLLNLGPAH